MLAALSLLTAWCAAAGPSGDSVALLRQATAPPAVPYYGRMIEVQWYGGRARAAVVQIFYKPTAMMRREVLARGDRPTMIKVTDGSQEWAIFPERKLAWKGEVAAPPPGLLSEEAQWELLQRNYRVAVRGEDEVAGRKVWVAEINSLRPGKPRQTLSIDKETGLILRARKYHADGSLASLFHFTYVRVPADIPDDYFSYQIPSDFKTAKPPDSLGPGGTREAAAPLPKAPSFLAAGFQLKGMDTIQVAGRSIAHVRYTDGLVPLSFFESPVAVYWKELTDLVAGEDFVPGGRVLQWTSKGRHYILIGDLSRPLLLKLAEEFKKGT